ncbi:BTB/POZ domain-containing protein [Humisphaera borealis]|uniref:Uncharacterized protein n=1 Tax=Humisphaera borealis TaxID=2807512 RepID=A0A7M2WYD4_9BACT|nr:hypothetical protein [Humisphaera borealis]QOV89841.1 hypothetical protein IPV69_00250 [Humisphaera borealis]
MRKQAMFAALLSFLFAGLSHGQVVYEPVQSQYRTDRATYYYGGSNPRVHAYVRQTLECFHDARSTRQGVYGVGYLHANLIGRPPQYVASDCAPRRNVSVFGYTSVDARDEAYDRVPRYFRMADLMASAVAAADGLGVVVPAQAAGSIDIRASVQPPATRPATGPAAQPKAILIIPKKTSAESVKAVTDAR